MKAIANYDLLEILAFGHADIEAPYTLQLLDRHHRILFFKGLVGHYLCSGEEE